MAQAFATAAELSIHTKGAVLANDPRSPLLLDGASEAVRRYVGWHLWPPRDETFTLDSEGLTTLQLPTMWVTGVSAVRVRGAALAPDGYEWSRVGLVRLAGGRAFPDAYRAVEVDAAHGLEACPADVKNVVLQVSAVALSSPLGATREQAGQVAVGWATTAPGVSGGLTLLDRDRAVLDRYRMVNAP